MRNMILTCALDLEAAIFLPWIVSKVPCPGFVGDAVLDLSTGPELGAAGGSDD